MNPTKIEWCDWSWNPAVGCSKRCHDENGKIWCYAYWQAKRMKQRCIKCYNFIPHIHRERLIEPYKKKKPSKIFLCSMGEFFDKKMKPEWQEDILEVIYDNPQHTFISLTKQPQNIPVLEYPENMWIGVSLNGKYDNISLNGWCRLLDDLREKVKIKFLSIEPYMEEINTDFIKYFDWIIIGGLTGHKKFSPPKEWIDKIVNKCDANNIPLFIKDNCHYSTKKREYPKVENNGRDDKTRERRFLIRDKEMDKQNNRTWKIGT